MRYYSNLRSSSVFNSLYQFFLLKPIILELAHCKLNTAHKSNSLFAEVNNARIMQIDPKKRECVSGAYKTFRHPYARERFTR